MTAAKTRTWTETTLGSAIAWTADGARVQVTSPRRGAWHVYVAERDCIGLWGDIIEEDFSTRGEAIREARYWVRRLAKPL